MINDPTFKAKECMIKDDGNLLCSELGFNVCEMAPNFDLENVINPFICSGTEKEVKVEVSGEKPTEGLIKLNNGQIDDLKFTISNNSVVMKKNKLVFEKDSELIYEADYVLLDTNYNVPYFDIKELDYDSLYYLNVSVPDLDYNISSRAIAGQIEGVLSFKHEEYGFLPFFSEKTENLSRYSAKIKIEKINEVADYGLRIDDRDIIYFYSNEFKPGPVKFYLQESSAGLTFELIKQYKELKFEGQFEDYVELEFIPYIKYNSNTQKKVQLNNFIEAGEPFYIIVMQEIDGKMKIRRYGGTTPKYQESHPYEFVSNSYYWGSDFYPGFSE